MRIDDLTYIWRSHGYVYIYGLSLIFMEEFCIT